MEISKVRRRYYSAQVCAQTQVHSLFPNSHSPMGRQFDTTGARSGAGPTALGVSHYQLPKLRAVTIKFLMEKPNNNLLTVIMNLIIIILFYLIIKFE